MVGSDRRRVTVEAEFHSHKRELQPSFDGPKEAKKQRKLISYMNE